MNLSRGALLLSSSYARRKSGGAESGTIWHRLASLTNLLSPHPLSILAGSGEFSFRSEMKGLSSLLIELGKLAFTEVA